MIILSHDLPTYLSKTRYHGTYKSIFLSRTYLPYLNFFGFVIPPTTYPTLNNEELPLL